MATKKPIRSIKTALTTPSETAIESPVEVPKEEAIETPADILEVNSENMSHSQSEGMTAEDQQRLNAVRGIDLEVLISMAQKVTKERKSERMNIALYPSLKKRLHRVAEAEKSSVNDLVIRLLDRGLEQYEH